MEKRLCKSRNDAMLAGVCSGLGGYLGLDATLIRLLLVIFCMIGGSGILLYIIMAIIMPDE